MFLGLNFILWKLGLCGDDHPHDFLTVVGHGLQPLSIHQQGRCAATHVTIGTTWEVVPSCQVGNKNHFESQLIDVSAMCCLFSLGVQNTTKLRWDQHTLTSLAVESYYPAESIEYQMKSNISMRSVHIMSHKPDSSQFILFGIMAEFLINLACGSVVDFTQVLRLKNWIWKALRGVKGPTAARSFLRIIQQPESWNLGAQSWCLMNARFAVMCFSSSNGRFLQGEFCKHGWTRAEKLELNWLKATEMTSNGW